MHNGSSSNVPDPYNLKLYSHLNKRKWNCYGQVVFNVEGHNVTKGIVTLSGLDPEVTTRQDMDELDPVFECNTCTQDGVHIRRCMRWFEAISHVLYTTSHGSERHTFTLITGDKF